MKKNTKNESATLRNSRDQSTESLTQVLDCMILGVKYLASVRNTAGELVDFEFVHINQLALETLFPEGSSKADVVGTRFLQQLPDLGKVNFQMYKEVVETGEMQEAELQYDYLESGQWFHQEVVKLEDGLVVTFKNVTHWKLEGIERQKNKQLIDSVYETASAGIDALVAQRDSSGQIVDFVYQRANQKSREMKALPNFDFIGKNLLVLYPGVKEDGLFDQYVAVVETGQLYHDIIYYGHENFQTWFDLTVSKWDDGIVMTLVDITDQKLAEAKAHEHASLLESVFNSSEAVLQQYAAQRDTQGEVRDFIYVKTNQKGLEMAGMPPDTDLTGKSLLELHPGVKETGVFDILKRVADSGEPEWRMFHYNQEGIDKWFQGNYRQLGDGVMVTITDISELKATEQKLHISERMFRTLVENTPDVINRLDTNLRYTFINSAFKEDTGLEPADFIGKTPYDLGLDAEATKDFVKVLETAIQTKTNQVHYSTVDTPAGANSVYSIVVPELNEETQVQSLLVITRDVTELKRSEQRAQESEHFLLATQEIAEIGSFAYDLIHNSLEGSPKLFDILGISHQESADFSAYLAKVHPDDRHEVITAINHAMQTSEDYRDEVRIVTESGEVKHLLIIGKVEEVDELNTIKMLGAVMDISHLRVIEQKLRERTQELELINQELSAFTYSVSHDLRTPLRAIYGYTDILQEEYHSKFDDEGKRLLNIVLTNVTRMERLISDLLNFAHLGKKQMITHSIDIEKIVKTTFQELDKTQNNRAQLIIQPLPTMKGDATMVRQVIENLLSNALKFSRDVEKPVIEVGLHSGGNHPVVYVKDNGAGFDQRYHHKLFEVFHRLHRSEDFKGTGVGLAIVQKIVQRHGGSIWAEGKVGQGATFFFSLAPSS